MLRSGSNLHKELVTIKRSINRVFALFAMLALLLVSAAAYADDTEVNLPHFTDGRINAFDINAPVGIFAVYAYPYADDINMGVLDSLEFWGYISSDTIDKVLSVTAAQIQDTDNSTGSAVVASANGYTLYRESDDTLTLVAPNLDGSTYQFNWTQSY